MADMHQVYVMDKMLTRGTGQSTISIFLFCLKCWMWRAGGPWLIAQAESIKVQERTRCWWWTDICGEKCELKLDSYTHCCHFELFVVVTSKLL